MTDAVSTAGSASDGEGERVDLGARPAVDAIVVAAMGSESEPYVTRAADVADAAEPPAPTTLGAYRAQHLVIEGQRILLVECGIGLVNAATATTWALTLVDAPLVISSGTAGGLAGVRTGDVAVGTAYGYAWADATAFGYAIGQIPGMPVSYAGDAELLRRAENVSRNLARGGFIPESQGGSRVPQVVLGPIMSGDTFVAGDLLTQLQTRWPDTIATDMESVAIAQVAHVHGKRFLSVRGISDLCAADEHNTHVDGTAAQAADLVIQLLTGDHL